MRMPKIAMDWSINLGSIVTLATILVGGMTTFYKLEEQVSNNTNNIIGMQLDRKQQLDDINRRFVDQTEAREKLASDVKEALKDQRDDIRQEFRDLRSDLNKKH